MFTMDLLPAPVSTAPRVVADHGPHGSFARQQRRHHHAPTARRASGSSSSMPMELCAARDRSRHVQCRSIRAIGPDASLDDIKSFERATDSPAMLFIGSFDPEEVAAIEESLGDDTSNSGVQCLWMHRRCNAMPLRQLLLSFQPGSSVDVDLSGVAPSVDLLASYELIEDMFSARTVATALAGASDHGSAEGVPGRTVLLVGEAARQRAGVLTETMHACGCQPAIVAALVPKHFGETLRGAAERVRVAHAEHYGLHHRIATDPRYMAVPDDATVAMNLLLDEGEVPLSDGSGPRQDASSIVVLDGLMADGERTSLLTWLTADGWDGSGDAPPDDRWAQNCVDHVDGVAGMPGASTWGLREHVVQDLQHSPPEPLIALQSRLAALYPEFDIVHLPVDALAKDDDEDGEGEEPQRLSAFVGNAVGRGSYRWHCDADPSQLPWDSPWAQYHGVHYNREPGKPLFVSALVYLNRSWPMEHDAETLAVDIDTDTGVFVRPRPGRVVLMDQDVPHRINPASASAEQLRVSLVLKLVFLPKPKAQQQLASIARPEWGPAVRFGSAAGPAVAAAAS